MCERIAPLCLMIVFLVWAPAARAESPGDDLSEIGELVTADHAGRRSRAARFEVDFKVAVTAPSGTKKLRVWLPLAQNSPVQKIADRRIETFPRPVPHSIHDEPVFGNRFAYFEFDSPAGTQLITHRFVATVHQVDWKVDYAAVRRPDHWPAALAAYQKLDPRAREGKQLSDVLGQIGESAQSPADQLVGAMKWVDRNLTYDSSVASLTADPMHGLTHRRGHCSDYHGLCSTLAQKVGYPSRVLYGLQMFDKASPSHCKMELFLPPYGWVTYDLSETQKLAIKIASDESLPEADRERQAEAVKRRTIRGFRENTWLQVTRGTNFDLAPAASQPVHLVRTVYAEADGQSLVDPGSAGKAAVLTMQRVDGDDVARRFPIVSE